MANNDNDVNSRLEQSTVGTPKINPDEQRKYLGTFRERVSLAIMIQDLGTPQAQQALETEIKAHPDYQLLVNGQVGQDQIGPFMKLASQNNVKFTIRTDSFYFTNPDSYGVVYAAASAINVSPVELHQKYPNLFQNDGSSAANPEKPSFMDKLKHLFK
ncbi:YueI family protein [Nicoliella spurrieriana]|uniref:YueI family protein n=1 Tax=Nicoliella spurrieriana TaxID=2925830 RepID=A0A976RS04_9LACO|nr:YueI family protein [Nicoliella spurrieriana]UQS86817.1 YueI family protein [Nicoliella spurrieriana]